VSVCGDAAAHPDVLPLLVGAGVRTVSVAPSALDSVRTLVQRLSADSCRRRFSRLVAASDPSPTGGLVSVSTVEVPHA
ncbi:MAG: putative PEP-binding protein, partial [Actinomycetes bacterium]